MRIKNDYLNELRNRATRKTGLEWKLMFSKMRINNLIFFIIILLYRMVLIQLHMKYNERNTQFYN